MHEMNLLCQTFQLLPVALNNSNVQQQYSAADIYTGTTEKQCNLGSRNMENLSTKRLHTAKQVYNDVCYDRFTAPKIDFSSTIKMYLPVPWSVVWTCTWESFTFMLQSATKVHPGKRKGGIFSRVWASFPALNTLFKPGMIVMCIATTSLQTEALLV